jgi:hypothetical protein
VTQYLKFRLIREKEIFKNFTELEIRDNVFNTIFEVNGRKFVTKLLSKTESDVEGRKSVVKLLTSTVYTIQRRTFVMLLCNVIPKAERLIFMMMLLSARISNVA